MRKVVVGLGVVLASAVITLALAVGGLLWAMFTTPDPNVRTEALFGSVFFESVENADGAILMEMGVANPWALLVMFVVVCAFLALFTIVYSRLRTYRNDLREDQNQTLAHHTQSPAVS